LVLSVKEKDLKENYSHVFRPLIDDLKKLESGVQIGGKLVKLGVICYSADNLWKRVLLVASVSAFLLLTSAEYATCSTMI
jgi:hypothetical protein